jgi:ATP-binding cassette subfamily F protein 3
VQSFDGDMEDYKKMVLDRAGGGGRETRRPKRDDSRVEPESASARARPDTKVPLKKRIGGQEEKMAKFADLIARIDKALSDTALFQREPAKAATLSRQRRELEKALVAAEDEWLTLTAQAEDAA